VAELLAFGARQEATPSTGSNMSFSDLARLTLASDGSADLRGRIDTPAFFSAPSAAADAHSKSTVGRVRGRETAPTL
jgi:hypothetical protein